jgi:ABC-type bacteriocin/lantibiotic exporter with double-glycine peptidase domain
MLKLKPYRQKPCFCGPASLKMVLEYYGVDKTEDELGRMAKTTIEDGTRGRRILNAARKLGFHGFVRDHCGIDDLRRWVVDKKVPVIVNWFSTDEGHYSVCVEVTDKMVYLMDPEIPGIKRFDHDTFLNVWFDFLHLHERTKDSLVLRRMIAVYPENWVKKV